MSAARVGGATVDELCEAAVEATGLDRFGLPGAPGSPAVDDRSHLDGLHALVDSLVADGRLSELGHVILRGTIHGALVNRLKAIDWAARHPEVRDEPVRAPIVVMGMPRTGTTLLSFLLEQDPFNRSLYVWEAADVVPPPELETWRGADPRLAAALERHRMTPPEIHAMHPMPPAGPTECVVLMASDFRSLQYETQAFVPGYGAWLDGCDYTSAYALHRVMLQVLSSRIPVERWALKTPNHLWALDTLLATYPDARIIWTHRDPIKTVGSVASLVATLQAPSTTEPRPHELGPYWAAKFRHAIDAANAVRDRPGGLGAARIVDLDFAGFMADPVGSVRGAYEVFGLELSDLAARRMHAWVDQNPADKHGRHRYTVDDFGISAGAVREQFADYTARYAVTAE